jgi:hypothetical protein
LLCFSLPTWLGLCQAYHGNYYFFICFSFASIVDAIAIRVMIAIACVLTFTFAFDLQLLSALAGLRYCCLLPFSRSVKPIKQSRVRLLLR